MKEENIIELNSKKNRNKFKIEIIFIISFSNFKRNKLFDKFSLNYIIFKIYLLINNMYQKYYINVKFSII